jgi:hypothetical protein
MIVLLAALACAGTWAAGQVRSIRDRSEVAKMTEKTKTICVGRYLVDVPSEAEVRLSGERISGFAIDTVEESDAAFHKRIAAREVEIAEHRADQDGNGEGGMIEARDLHIPGLVGRSFVYGRSRGYMMNGDRRVDMESVSIEVHAHMRGLSFSLSATSKQESGVREAEALLARLQMRGEEEIPAVPGFCIWRGVFAEPLPENKNEHVILHLGLPGHPDMGLALSSTPSGQTGRSLLERVAETDAEATADEILRVTKLRSGARTINELAGEEILERSRELNFATTYGFVWEAEGAPDDPKQPYVSLELHGGVSSQAGGKPVDTSLHGDAVLSLWDRISSSIRLRTVKPLAKPVPRDKLAAVRRNPV